MAPVAEHPGGALDRSAAPRSLEAEVESFETVQQQIDIGDYKIRRNFAWAMVILFIATNAFVMAGLGVVFWIDWLNLTAGRITPSERIINATVIETLIGATTVQLGTVILTIVRAIFHVRPPGRLN